MNTLTSSDISGPGCSGTPRPGAAADRNAPRSCGAPASAAGATSDSDTLLSQVPGWRASSRTESRCSRLP